ncbi:uncharacterized protein cubi_02016 [Cryptosporidium ubiquitum]|uniref:Uncharacterized protein n=1 Tax=Cryptosporidium ubiquitum TaxID=857276 RepID=A0A1J4MN76_9CRYT|nr:uncharacterized protein cubi_02016 [Cryptosporidium ubiquitum]OII75495.1 hypothetical protein cubi_02016 [Cryptosporidium ubiquitum]
MYNQQKILISNPNSLCEGSQSFSPPSTTLTPSSTPSNTPTTSSSSIPTPNIAQIASIATSHMTNQQILSPFMFQQGINQGFNNGMLNTALYNDPTLLQLFFTNLFQGNNGFMPSIYPYGCGYAPYIPGGTAGGAAGATVITGTKNGIPGVDNISISQTLKDNVESAKNLETKLVKTNASDNLGQVILSTPERAKQENILPTDKIEITGGLENGNIDDTSLKKRRKECSIDSVNSIVETVATETNSNMDESSTEKKSIIEVETRSFEISQEDDTENTGEEDDSEHTTVLEENLMENVRSSSQYLHLKSEEAKSNTNNLNSSIGGGSNISATSHEDELFLSNDRKTSFDKIMRIHSSLIGSLSWTVPTDKDDTILKSVKENNGNGDSDAPNNKFSTGISNSSSSTNKHGESSKSLNQNGQDEYNPFIQRDYNPANVACFSPRMLPDWQLNWLRDVTRSLSNVPKSPMTGIHFDRTKPAWAVSYYECETRKYYFFFIPDLSEYTIEITLAAAIGCRQNVVARGAHKRKKPGVLTFNLYSGQFEKSTSEAHTINEIAPEHSGICRQGFRKNAILGANNACNNMKIQCAGPINHQNSGASSILNNTITPEFSGNNQTQPNSHHLSTLFVPNRNHINLLDPSMSTLSNFHVTSQMHAHPHAGAAQFLFPHMAINGQHSSQPAAMASLMQGASQNMMLETFQQNALRNASLLYAAALSSSGPTGLCGAVNAPHLPINNPVSSSIAISANVGPAIVVDSSSLGNIDANTGNCGNQVILPSETKAVSTSPNAQTTFGSNNNAVEKITKSSVVPVSNNNTTKTSVIDNENITCTTTDSACIPVAPVTPALSSSNENSNNSNIMLDRVALGKLV